MALYKYFKKVSALPSPDRPLSARVPTSSILNANKKVGPLLKKSECKSPKPTKKEVST